MSEENRQRKLPPWFWLAAAGGLAWNIYGVIQFLPSVNGSVETLMGQGMTLEQAQFYLQLPSWMTGAFAVGVFGGTLGCLMLLARTPLARPVLGVSLLAYVALYIGDVTQGVFTMFGVGQAVVLTVVVLIAAALLWLSVFQQRRYSW
ncbi:MAG: hypothetical protein QE265_09220 [Rhodoferax sp.]|nr:hypothetical protein [Rhodoferax sp.]